MKKVLKDIAAGADPEVFIVDKKSGTFIPSLDLIGGNKMMPRPTSKKGFYLQEDNVLGEYNIPPSKTVEEFRDNCLLGLQLFAEVLPPAYTVKIATSHKFEPIFLEDPRAKELGCSPDQNAWFDGALNPTPQVPDDGMRCAGGHFHLSYSFDYEAMRENSVQDLTRDLINRELVKWGDLYAAIPALVIDKDTDRRRLYGKAGAYRDKHYGVEYRTLSSFWLQSPTLIEWVYRQMMRAVDKVSSLEFIPRTDYERIQASINRNDVSEIPYFQEKYSIELA